MKFSQKIGKIPIKTILQVDSMDQDLRNRLWNTLLDSFFYKLDTYAEPYAESDFEVVCKLIWKDHFNYPIDQIPMRSNKTVNTDAFITIIRNKFFEAAWYEIYDLLEIVSRIDSRIYKVGFTAECNWALEKEVSGYRIINESIARITSEQEIKEIEDCLSNTDQWNSVSNHLQAAIDDLSDRNNPNYRNSIKESISAVEAYCKIVTKNDRATLGDALKVIERQYKIHPALQKAITAIYGYTSDAGGIRHALLEDDLDIQFEDAKFMLVSCTAFINYMVTKIG